MAQLSRHWGDMPADDLHVSRNLRGVPTLPRHPFTDPPLGTDDQPMEADFIGSRWFLMYGHPPVNANKIWVELHNSLAAANDYLAGAPSLGYVSLWRAQPPAKLAAALRRRTPWSRLRPSTRKGYGGRLSRQAGIRDTWLQAQWHRWAPHLKWLRRHGDHPPEYWWASLWPQH